MEVDDLSGSLTILTGIVVQPLFDRNSVGVFGITNGSHAINVDYMVLKGTWGQPSIGSPHFILFADWFEDWWYAVAGDAMTRRQMHHAIGTRQKRLRSEMAKLRRVLALATLGEDRFNWQMLPVAAGVGA
jgi:hypothetical protein